MVVSKVGKSARDCGSIPHTTLTQEEPMPTREQLLAELDRLRAVARRWAYIINPYAKAELRKDIRDVQRQLAELSRRSDKGWSQ